MKYDMTLQDRVELNLQCITNFSMDLANEEPLFPAGERANLYSHYRNRCKGTPKPLKTALPPTQLCCSWMHIHD